MSIQHKHLKQICWVKLALILLWLGLTSTPAWSANELVRDEIQNEITAQEAQVRARDPEPFIKEPQAEIELEKDKELPPAIKGPSFTLTQVNFEDNTLFKASDFKIYLDLYLGKKISFQDLRDLTLLITNHYRSRGYVTSRAYIPPQSIDTGVITMKIIEGKVGKVIVEDNRWFRKGVYKNSMPLKKDQIFRVQDLENGLKTINSQPDRSAKAYLIAGEEPLTSDIILKAKEKFPIHAAYEFNNRGSKLTHRARHEVSLTDNNLLGFGDIFSMNLSLAEQNALTGASFNYRLPVFQTKSFFTLESSIVHTRLAKHLREFKIRGKSWSLTPGIQQTFYENRRLTLSGYLGFEIKDSKTAIDEEKISFDRMRVIKTGPRVDIRDKWGRTSLGAEVHWGIPGFLGASDAHDLDSTREGAGGKFIYFTPTASRVQKLPFNLLLLSRANAQLSSLALASPEQFRSGGAFSVRGYPEGDSSGDSGFNIVNEIRIPSFFIPNHWLIPRTKHKLRDSLSFVAFYDTGYTHFDSRSTPGIEKTHLLMGTGYGIRLNIDRYLSFMFDMGFPVGDESTDKDLPQIHMSVRSEY